MIVKNNMISPYSKDLLSNLKEKYDIDIAEDKIKKLVPNLYNK